MTPGCSTSSNPDGTRRTPWVIWLAGGPSCSRELAFFYENGPFHIADDMSLLWNEFGWDQESNLIYVDQPIGTGFSYSSDLRDTRHNKVRSATTYMTSYRVLQLVMDLQIQRPMKSGMAAFLPVEHIMYLPIYHVFVLVGGMVQCATLTQRRGGCAV